LASQAELADLLLKLMLDDKLREDIGVSI